MNKTTPSAKSMSQPLSIRRVRVFIFFGGPSNERNISLDSARSFYDSIRERLQPRSITLIFISPAHRFYIVKPEWIYCNTIEDFEALILNNKPHPQQKFRAGNAISSAALKALLRKADVCVPFVHGRYGEDGALTRFLEQNTRNVSPSPGIVGCAGSAYATSYDKTRAKVLLNEQGFLTPPGISLNMEHVPCWKPPPQNQQPATNSNKTTSAAIRRAQLQSLRSSARQFRSMLKANAHPPQSLVIVKPNTGGSSDGISLVKLDDIVSMRAAFHLAFCYAKTILIEAFIQGSEFSLTLMEEGQGSLLPFLPTEIELLESSLPQTSAGKTLHFYTRERKYMPEASTRHHTPARYSQQDLVRIMRQGKSIFKLFKLRDWGRLDGFLTQTGKIIWTEVNSITGYGMDSLIFQQSTLWNISATRLSLTLIENALARSGQSLYRRSTRKKVFAPANLPAMHARRSTSALPKRIVILGGGENSERQVSRMSWFNVIEKLSALNHFQLRFLFMDQHKQLWELPRFLTLKHTVEELEAIIADPAAYRRTLQTAATLYQRFSTQSPSAQQPSLSAKYLQQDDSAHLDASTNFVPRRIALKKLKAEIDFLFIALHGGSGEDGTLQRRLHKLGIPHNGSPALASAIASNKYRTRQFIQTWLQREASAAANIAVIPAIATSSSALIRELSAQGLSSKAWQQLCLRTQHALSQATANENPTAGDFHNLSALAQHPSFRRAAALLTIRIKSWMQKLASPQGIVLKPQRDGCSTAVTVIKPRAAISLGAQATYYMLALSSGVARFPSGVLTGDAAANTFQTFPPTSQSIPLLAEVFINGENIIELTIGVLEQADGSLLALMPSRTLAANELLSLDEKFHKGIGINLTPPQELSAQAIAAIRKSVVKLAQALGIRGYARIDAFYELHSRTLRIIEVNTLPGLTVATVLYTQALVTPKLRLQPAELLCAIIQAGAQRAPALQ